MVLSYILTSGSKDPKHQSLPHSVYSYILMMSLNVGLMVYFSEPSNFIPTNKQLLLSLILISYSAFLFSSRFITDRKSHIGQISVYDMFWQCNVSLVLSAIGALLGKRDIVGAGVASIALDQTMWWVDLITYISWGKFGIGVSKYLVWPETALVKKITSTHHLWFIPLCAFLNDGLPWNSVILSMILVATMSVVSRLIIPFEIPYKGRLVYMNINCTYECWKDVKIWVLHLADRNSYLDKHFIYAFLLLNTAWNTGNFLCFAVIKFYLG